MCKIKKMIITIVVVIVSIICLLRLGGLRLSREEVFDVYPDFLVMGFCYNEDTIYYANLTFRIYPLLNMKIVDESRFEKILYENTKKHLPIEVDSVLFDILKRDSVSVVTEIDDVKKIYDKDGLFSVLDHYIKYDYMLDPKLEWETQRFILYLAYLHNIYFFYVEDIDGDGFCFSLEETANERLASYRDSIKSIR